MIMSTLKLSERSMSRNCDVILKLLDEWSNAHIKAGTQDEWRAAARKSGFSGHAKNADLLIDSFDLPLERRKGKRGKKSDDWSYKLNRPGRRFTAVIDASMCIRLLSDGYSPKLYDGHFLQSHKRERDKIFWRDRCC
jgi:hypothetical protein